MPAPYDTAPASEFEESDFWELHKTKILAYGALLVIGLVIFTVYQVIAQRTASAARLAFAEAKTQEQLQQVIAKYPSATVGGDASLLLAGKLRAEGKFDDAEKVLRAMIEHSPEHPMIAGAWLSLGETQNAAGKGPLALDTYQQVVTRYSGTYAAPEAKLAVAKLLAGEKKTDEARHELEDLIAKFADSPVVQQAQEELRRLK